MYTYMLETALRWAQDYEKLGVNRKNMPKVLREAADRYHVNSDDLMKMYYRTKRNSKK